MKARVSPSQFGTVIRSTAMLVAVLFLFTEICSFPSQALANPSSSSNLSMVQGGEKPAAFLSQPLHESGWLPPELGTIDEIYRNTESRSQVLGSSTIEDPEAGTWGRKFVIFIQDAHDSLEAQENIAKIIELLVGNYGVRTVFEEGYEGPVPTDELFAGIEDSELRRKVSYFFLDHLRLRAAEYAHINRRSQKSGPSAQVPGSRSQKKLGPGDEDLNSDFKLIGADSLALHQANIDQYRLSAEKKDVITKDLKVLEKELRQMVDAHFPKEFREWLKVKELFDSKKLDLFTYLNRTMPLLTVPTYIQPRRLDWVPGPSKSGDLDTGTQDRFSGLLSFILEAVKSNDPAVIEKARHIDAREVFEELFKLEQVMAETYLGLEPRAKSFEPSSALSALLSADLQLYQHYRTLRLVERLNDLEVTQEEYASLLGHGPRASDHEAEEQNRGSWTVDRGPGLLVGTQALGEFIHEHTKKPLVLSKQWERNIQDAVKFYEIAQERDGALGNILDEYFLSKSETRSTKLETNSNNPNSNDANKNVSGLNDSNLDIVSDFGFRNSDLAILVYGGFHKENIKRILESKGISYVVVSPKITKSSPRHEEYYKKLMTVGHLPFEVPFLVRTAASPNTLPNLPRLEARRMISMAAELIENGAPLGTLDQVIGEQKSSEAVPATKVSVEQREGEESLTISKMRSAKAAVSDPIASIVYDYSKDIWLVNPSRKTKGYARILRDMEKALNIVERKVISAVLGIEPSSLSPTMRLAVTNGSKKYLLISKLKSIFLHAIENGADSVLQLREKKVAEAVPAEKVQLDFYVFEREDEVAIRVVNNGVDLSESEDSAAKVAKKAEGRPRIGGRHRGFKASKKASGLIHPDAQVSLLERRDVLGDGSGAVFEIVFPKQRLDMYELVETATLQRGGSTQYVLTSWKGLEELDKKIVMNSSGQIKFAGEEPVVKLSKDDFDLYVERHAQSYSNAGDFMRGDELTELGQKQAEISAGKLFSILEPELAAGADLFVITSTKKRSQDTARPFVSLVRSKMKLGLTFERRLFLDEIPMNFLEKGTLSGAILSIPGVKGFLKRFLGNLDARVAKSLGLGGSPETESFLGLLSRSKSGLEELKREMKERKIRNGGRKIIVVAFGHKIQINALMTVLGVASMVDPARGIIDWYQTRFKNTELVYFDPNRRDIVRRVLWQPDALNSQTPNHSSDAKARPETRVWKTTDIARHDPRHFTYTIKTWDVGRLLRGDAEPEFYSASLVNQDFLHVYPEIVSDVGVILEFPDDNIAAVLKFMGKDIVATNKDYKAAESALQDHERLQQGRGISNVLYNALDPQTNEKLITPGELIRSAKELLTPPDDLPPSGYDRNNEIILKNDSNLKVKAAFLAARKDWSLDLRLERLRNHPDIFPAIQKGLPLVIIAEEGVDLEQVRNAINKKFPELEETSPFYYVQKSRHASDPSPTGTAKSEVVPGTWQEHRDPVRTEARGSFKPGLSEKMIRQKEAELGSYGLDDDQTIAKLSRMIPVKDEPGQSLGALEISEKGQQVLVGFAGKSGPYLQAVAWPDPEEPVKAGPSQKQEDVDKLKGTDLYLMQQKIQYFMALRDVVKELDTETAIWGEGVPVSQETWGGWFEHSLNRSLTALKSNLTVLLKNLRELKKYIPDVPEFLSGLFEAVREDLSDLDKISLQSYRGLVRMIGEDFKNDPKYWDAAYPGKGQDPDHRLARTKQIFYFPYKVFIKSPNRDRTRAVFCEAVRRMEAALADLRQFSESRIAQREAELKEEYRTVAEPKADSRTEARDAARKEALGIHEISTWPWAHAGILAALEKKNWYWRTAVVMDSKKSVRAFKFLRQGEDVSEWEHEARILKKLRELNLEGIEIPDLFETPEGSVFFRMEKKPANVPYSVDPSYRYFSYKTRPEYFIYPEDIFDAGLMRQCGVNTMRGLGQLLRAGFIHESLAPLSHADGLVKSWKWDHAPLGGVENMEEATNKPNIRLSGPADFAHVRKIRPGENVYRGIIQEFCEFAIVITYRSLKNGITEEQTASLLHDSYDEWLVAIGSKQHITGADADALLSFVRLFHGEFNKLDAPFQNTPEAPVFDKLVEIVQNIVAGERFDLQGLVGLQSLGETNRFEMQGLNSHEARTMKLATNKVNRQEARTSDLKPQDSKNRSEARDFLPEQERFNKALAVLMALEKGIGLWNGKDAEPMETLASEIFTDHDVDWLDADFKDEIFKKYQQGLDLLTIKKNPQSAISVFNPLLKPVRVEQVRIGKERMQLLSGYMKIHGLFWYDTKVQPHQYVFFQGTYKKYRVGSQNVSVRTYGERRFLRLWEAFRAVDHQIESKLDEIVHFKKDIEQLEPFKVRAERAWQAGLQGSQVRASKFGVPEAQDLLNVITTVLPDLKTTWSSSKELAQAGLVAVGDAAFQSKIFKVYTQLSREMLRLQKQIDSAQRIISRIEKGRLTIMKEYLERIDNDLSSKLEKMFHASPNSQQFLNNGYALRKKLETNEDPEFRRLRGLIIGAMQTTDESRRRRYLRLARNKINAAQMLHKWMDIYRNRYKEMRLGGIEGEQASEDAFREVYGKFLVRQKIRAGSAEAKLWKLRFYQAVKVPLHISDKNERLPNPVFEAFSALIYLAETQDIDTILAAHSVITKTWTPVLYEFLEQFKGETVNGIKAVGKGQALIEALAQSFEIGSKELSAVGTFARFEARGRNFVNGESRIVNGKTNQPLIANRQSPILVRAEARGVKGRSDELQVTNNAEGRLVPSSLLTLRDTFKSYLAIYQPFWKEHALELGSGYVVLERAEGAYAHVWGSSQVAWMEATPYLSTGRSSVDQFGKVHIEDAYVSPRILPKDISGGRVMVDLRAGFGIRRVLEKDEEFVAGSWGHAGCIGYVIKGREAQGKTVLIQGHFPEDYYSYKQALDVMENDLIEVVASMAEGLEDVQIVLSPQRAPLEGEAEAIKERIGPRVKSVSIFPRQGIISLVSSKEGVAIDHADTALEYLQEKKKLFVWRWEDLKTGSVDLLQTGAGRAPAISNETSDKHLLEVQSSKSDPTNSSRIEARTESRHESEIDEILAALRHPATMDRSFKLKEPMVFVVEQATIAKMKEPVQQEILKWLFGFAAVNKGKLHVMIPDQAKGTEVKWAEKWVEELKSEASVYGDLREVPGRAMLPVFYFAKAKDESVWDFLERLKWKNKGFAAGKSTFVDIGDGRGFIAAALLGKLVEKLPVTNGFHYAKNNEYFAPIFDAVHALFSRYFVVATSA